MVKKVHTGKRSSPTTKKSNTSSKSKEKGTSIEIAPEMGVKAKKPVQDFKIKKDSKKTTSSDIQKIDSNIPTLKENIKTSKPLKIKDTKPEDIKKKKNGKFVFKVILFSVLFFVCIGIGAGVVWSNQLLNNAKKSGIDFDPVEFVIPSEDPQLSKKDNKTNVLLVGIDTRGSSNLENTDSIMVASYDHETHRISLVSIARDNIATFRVGKDNKTVIRDYRINAAYAIARNNNYPGGGLALLRKAVTEMIGLEIQYSVQVNFQAFKEIIDNLGGIEVEVEQAFTDREYPKDDDSGTMTVKFNVGKQVMDGKTALQFARSRHSYDNTSEATDYARARRQQKVIVALQEKIKQTSWITDPGRVSEFMNIFGNNVKIEETDDSSSSPRNVETEDIKAVLKIKDLADTKKILSTVIDPNIGGCNRIIKEGLKIGEASVIGPALGLGKFDDVKRYIKFVLEKPDLFQENKQDCYDNPFAEVTVVDNGFGYTNVLKNITELNQSFISTSYLTKIASPIVTQKADPATQVVEKQLTTVGIYDITKKYPLTKAELLQKYNAIELTEDQVPTQIKNHKGHDLVLIFPKEPVPSSTPPSTTTIIPTK